MFFRQNSYPEGTYALINKSVLYFRHHNKWKKLGESQIKSYEYDRFMKQVSKPPAYQEPSVPTAPHESSIYPKSQPSAPYNPLYEERKKYSHDV